ncbi:g5291 [Coccomyxa elongata]
MERLNGVVEKVITTFPDNVPWDEMLPSVMLSVRTAYHSSTKMSPAQALMGKELVLPGLLTMSVYIDYPCKDLQGTPDVDGFDADAVRVTAHHVQEVTKMQDTEVLLLENIKKASAIQSKKSITVKRKRASHQATKQLPHVGGYAMLRINNPTKLSKRFENGVYKVVDFNAIKTVVQLEDMSGLCWNESTDNIKKYP